MHLSLLLTASCLLLAVLGSQIPIADKQKLSRVIADSLFLTLHRTLVEINSVTNQEYDVASWLTDFLQAHYFKVIKQEVEPRVGVPVGSKARLNVYTWPDPDYYGHSSRQRTGRGHLVPSPKVLLTSHIDTVPPFIPYSLHYNSSSHHHFNRSDVLIKGRGTVDDKACVAAQITTVMDFLSSPPEGLDFEPSDLGLLFVVDEESGGAGMRTFSDSHLYRATNTDYKAILFGEPTERKLVAGHKGYLGLRVDAHGKAAHSGYPWLGRSANSMILPALVALDELQYLPVDQGGLPGTELFGNTTINVGLMQGGVAANVMPERAFAELAFRLAGGTVDENKDVVETVIAEADPEGALSYEFLGRGYGPVKCDTDVDGFDTITVNYGTDVPNLNVGEGVKKYLYGPGSIFVAHGADEGLTVGELEAGLEGYKRLLEHALRL